MQLDNKNSVRLSELIKWVKKEILVDQILQDDDPLPLFAIDEVTVEVNFVLTGEGEGGFDVRIVKVGATVGEERIQKATVRMKPIVPYSQVVDELNSRYPEIKEKIIDNSVKVLLKGSSKTSDEHAVIGQRQ